MLGFLNIYKPSGITSNAVVQKLKKKFHISKIGHLGTLDPLACGVLPIAVGKATRMFDYSLNKTKRYTAIFDFGYTTDTLDIEGVVTQENGIIPNKQEILEASKKLLGSIDQIPPLYSAKCVNGRRAYDLAREGIAFELKPKNITIFQLDMLEKISENQYKFDIVCSSGTYIRAIARDLGELCGTYGCMSYLERTETGTFAKDNAIELDKLLEEDICVNYLISPIDAFNNFDVFEVNREIMIDLLNGKKPKCLAFSKPTFVICKGEIIGVAKCNVNELIIETFLYEQKDN